MCNTVPYNIIYTANPSAVLFYEVKDFYLVLNVSINTFNTLLAFSNSFEPILYKN